MKRPKIYYVYTYDWELGRFTPQIGVRPGPYTIWGVRRALRRLQGLGYDIGRDAPSVLVTNTNPKIMECA